MIVVCHWCSVTCSLFDLLVCFWLSDDVLSLRAPFFGCVVVVVVVVVCRMIVSL